MNIQAKAIKISFITCPVRLSDVKVKVKEGHTPEGA